MRTEYRGAARRDQYGSRINRRHTPLLALGIPYASIMLGSLLPTLFIATAAPLVPPLGLMLLVAWRLLRPGILPVWIGFPLGMFDDLFSGAPFGSAMLLWSVAMISIETLEARFPWRGFLQDWLTSTLVLSAYILTSSLLSGGVIGRPMIEAMLPQLLLTAVMFPIVSRMVANLDRLRLMRVRSS